MRYHPQRASIARTLSVISSLALLLAGCAASGGPSPSPTSSGSTTPTSSPSGATKTVFAPLASVESTGAYETFTSLAADESSVVVASAMHGGIERAGFLYSSDGGSTFARGSIDQQSAAEVVPGELVGVLSVSKRQSGKLWLGLSAAEGHFYSWTSTDGLSWRRTPTKGIDAPRATIRAAQGVDSGFILVGVRDVADGQPTKPAVWRSSDGIQWTETLLPMGGWLGSVSASGQTLVATGGTDLGVKSSGARRQEILAVRSTDGGQTWTRSTLAEPSGSKNFSAESSTVAAGPKGFVAAGVYFKSGEKGYLPWVANSPDGVTWVQASPPGTLNPGSRVGFVKSVGSSIVIGQNELVSGVRSLRMQAWDGKQWSEADEPGGRPFVVGVRSAVVGDNVALVAVESSTRPNGGALWRSSDAGHHFTEVKIPLPDSIAPVVLPTALTATGAFGEAQGQQAAWMRTSGGPYDSPVKVDASPSDQLTGAASSPQGTLLWGSHTEFGNDHARSWYAPTGAPFSQSKTYAFNDVLEYHWSSVSDALWVKDRWVAVGTKSTNGHVRRSALAMTSTDGLVWAQGAPAATFRRGDTFNSTDPLTDLDGLEHSGRGMSGVAPLGGGVVSVGWREEADISQAAFWLCPSLLTWTMAELPHDGLASSAATAVATSGSTVVAVGWGAAKADGLSVGYVWTSPDSGKTWTRQHLGAEQPAQPLLVSVAQGTFVIVQGQDHDKSLKAWQSKNGSTWTPVTPDIPDRGVASRVSVNDLQPTEDGIDLLLRVYDNADAQAVIGHVLVA